MIRIRTEQRSLPRINLLVGFVLLALLCGCVEVEQVLSLNADGSGLVDLTYTISEDQLARLKAITSEWVDGGDGVMGLDASEEEIRREFKEYEPYGVVLQSVRSAVREGAKQRRLVISFKNLEGLARSGFLSDRNVSLVRNAQGDYVFTQIGAAGGGEDVQMANDMAADPVMARMMKGFKVTLHIRTPSRILSTNAPEHGDRTATWRFDLDEDVMAVEQVAKLTTQVVFEGKGLNIREFRTGKGGPVQ